MVDEVENYIRFASENINIFFDCTLRHKVCTSFPYYPLISQRIMLESPVVGYNTYTMHEGYNIYTPTFESVTAADKKLNLQDLKLLNTDGWATESIYVLSDDGTTATGHTYTWNCAGNTGLDYDCWIDDDTGAEAEDVFINEGDGFYISCMDGGVDGTGIKIQVAGSVKFGKFVHTMHEGYNLTGNFCPKTVDIQGLKLVNTDGWATESIYELSEDGTTATGHTYTWNCAGNTGLDHDCWIDDDTGAEAEGYSLTPGQGIYLSCMDAGVDGTGIKVEIDPVLIKE